MPQPPQSLAVVSVLIHLPPHNISPSGQAHLPSVHGKPPEHLVAQSPQWLASVWASVQALSQMMSVASAHLHCPAWHDWPAVQVVGQEPQCSELVCRSTQLPSHDVLPAGQPQVPPEHACPLAHLVPQAPHELAVVCRSTQASPQRVRPLGQAWVLGMQLVTAQISPV
jgi:hypothetical protein